MPNEVSLGEVARTLERVETAHKSEIQRLEREHRSDIERVERDRTEDMRKLREDVIKPLADRMVTQEARPQMTFTNRIALYGLIFVFISVVIAAWVATKGAK